MSASKTAPVPVEIDADDRLNARRLAAARVLFALVEAMKVELGNQAPIYYESHLALGTGKALWELADGQLVPARFKRLDAALPDMVEDFFLRAEAVMKSAGTEGGS